MKVEDIVQQLAKQFPGVWKLRSVCNGFSVGCVHCFVKFTGANNRIEERLMNPNNHQLECVWRKAVEWVAEQQSKIDSTHHHLSQIKKHNEEMGVK